MQPGAGEQNVAHPAPRSARFGWIMFDWAQQPFHTLVTSFLFAPYFVSGFVGDPIFGQALWGYATAAAGLVVALTAPLLGAMADISGRRKPWVLLFSILMVVPTAALWYAEPNVGASGAGTGVTSGLLLWFIVACFALATVAAESAIVFNNALMPTLVPPSQIGRLSGTAWAVGYAGGIVSLLVMAGLVVTDGETGRTLLGLAPVISLDSATREPDRIVGPFTALWYIVFVLPFFLFTPDTPTAVKARARDAFSALGATLRHVRDFPGIVVFLIARMFYIDGLLAIFTFGGIYGSTIFAWRPLELGLFGIIMTVSGVFGALIGGRADDRFGARSVIVVALLGLITAAVGILSITRDSVLFGIMVGGPSAGDGLFASTPEQLYLAFAVLIGFVAGPLQSASRTLLARLSPPDRMTQFFGLFAFSGKVTSFVAPLVVGIVTTMTQDQRLGIASVVLFLLAGLVLMVKVPSK